MRKWLLEIFFCLPSQLFSDIFMLMEIKFERLFLVVPGNFIDGDRAQLLEKIWGRFFDFLVLSDEAQLAHDDVFAENDWNRDNILEANLLQTFEVDQFHHRLSISFRFYHNCAVPLAVDFRETNFIIRSCQLRLTSEIVSIQVDCFLHLDVIFQRFFGGAGNDSVYIRRL